MPKTFHGPTTTICISPPPPPPPTCGCGEVDFFPVNKRERFLQVNSINSVTSLLFLSNILKRPLHLDKHESLIQFDSIISMGMVKHYLSSQYNEFAIPLQYLKKEIKDKVDFLYADKHQSFLKAYFNTLRIKVSYKTYIIIINRHDQAFSDYSK